MIYCNLKGGLGNMMFQIAATESLAIDRGTDCSFPNLYQQLNNLNNYNLYNRAVSTDGYMEIFKSLKWNSPPTKRIGVYNYPFHFAYHSLPNDDIMIDGFFQSEKYFVHNREGVLDLFRVPNSILDTINEKYTDLLKKRTTSIHVRRGDYLKHPDVHPVQTPEYYKHGMELLKDQTDIFIVCSDDIPWCKENIKGDNVVYIEDEREYVELYLMSLCNNNIICNSSFGWWGAWLNESPNKIVIGPKIWFGTKNNHLNTDDVIPETWIKI